jgi:hypothetical protein
LSWKKSSSQLRARTGMPLTFLILVLLKLLLLLALTL